MVHLDRNLKLIIKLVSAPSTQVCGPQTSHQGYYTWEWNTFLLCTLPDFIVNISIIIVNIGFYCNYKHMGSSCIYVPFTYNCNDIYLLTHITIQYGLTEVPGKNSRSTEEINTRTPLTLNATHQTWLKFLCCEKHNALAASATRAS